MIGSTVNLQLAALNYFTLYQIKQIEDVKKTKKDYHERPSHKTSGELAAMIFSYRNGYYFGVDDESEAIIKYKPDHGKLVKTDTLQLNKNSVWQRTSSWFTWVNRDTLLLGSSMSGKKIEYCLIDTWVMKLVVSIDCKYRIPTFIHFLTAILCQKKVLIYSYFRGLQITSAAICYNSLFKALFN